MDGNRRMIMKKAFCLVAALLLAAACHPEDRGTPAQENTPPKLAVKLPAAAKAGATVKGTVEVTFAEGLHGYQNPPSDKDLIPIVLTVDSKDVKLKPVTYP